MSDSSAAQTKRSARPGEASTGQREDERGRLERTVPNLAEPIRKTGFWTAIVIPFLYVPILLNGLATWLESTAFLGLLLTNLLALYVGHAHRRNG
ncbi:hypothetical protein [Natrarchaeobius oligotrophus]|uniref:Uncharacterized protein n=1 Tax=Natrarchaeobius chitinivorans TaxID=1679083 RepID=A0A3N6PN36_NATCH|nr:hypothetical protein [Natrarchaeobius chitinivorans]RQH00496.1 hypothetical protein EA472_11715 [Natrarchaeobius chitinivorans]